MSTIQHTPPATTPPSAAIEPARATRTQWRALISDHGSYVLTEIQSGPHPWTTLQHWATPITDANRNTDRALLIAATAATHGWELPTTWPTTTAQSITLNGITAADWHRILTEATAHRTRLQHELDQVETVWQEAIVSARTHGAIPMAQLVEAAGVTRARVYQILRAHTPTTSE